MMYDFPGKDFPFLKDPVFTAGRPEHLESPTEKILFLLFSLQPERLSDVFQI